MVPLIVVSVPYRGTVLLVMICEFCKWFRQLEPRVTHSRGWKNASRASRVFVCMGYF